MSGVASGKLRHRVALQALTVGQDPGTGEPLDSWETIATPWAEIAPLSVREFVSAAAEQSEVRGRITIRYRDNVDASMRIVHRGKYYAIHGVMTDAESGIEHISLAVGEGVRLEQ